MARCHGQTVISYAWPTQRADARRARLPVEERALRVHMRLRASCSWPRLRGARSHDQSGPPCALTSQAQSPTGAHGRCAPRDRRTRHAALAWVACSDRAGAPHDDESVGILDAPWSNAGARSGEGPTATWICWWSPFQQSSINARPRGLSPTCVPHGATARQLPDGAPLPSLRSHRLSTGSLSHPHPHHQDVHVCFSREHLFP